MTGQVKSAGVGTCVPSPKKQLLFRFSAPFLLVYMCGFALFVFAEDNLAKAT